MNDDSIGTQVSLEQLLALNDEIAALVRAGVPLEQGLTELGQDAHGKLGRLASFLAEQLSRGQSLTQVLARNEDRFPPLWRAVVQAGLRGGNLSAALESLAETGERVAEIRRSWGLALVYPLIVVLLAFACFIFFVTHVAPNILSANLDLVDTRDPFLPWMTWLGEHLWWWVWIPPALILLLLWRWQRSTSRALVELKGGAAWRTPGLIRDSLREGRMATFAEILSLLVRQQVPFHEGLLIAGESCGDSRLRDSAGALSARLRDGESIPEDDADLRAFPPLLGWLIANGSQSTDLARSLSDLAERYRLRSAQGVTWMTVYLPIVMTVVVGGTVTLLYGCTLFVPLCRLLYQLAASTGTN